MRSFSDKEPLVKTLSRYVKVVRSEHCFLLFEELGKADKWLQCLEVCLFLSLSPDFIFGSFLRIWVFGIVIFRFIHDMVLVRKISVFEKIIN